MAPVEEEVKVWCFEWLRLRFGTVLVGTCVLNRRYGDNRYTDIPNLCFRQLLAGQRYAVRYANEFRQIDR